MTRHKRLIWRIFLPFLLIVLISLISMTGYTSHSIKQFLLNQTENELKDQALMTESRVWEYLLPVDRAGIQQFCRESGQSVTTRMTIILPDGEVVGDSDENPAFMDDHRRRPEVAAALTGQVGTSVRFSGTVSQNMMYLAIPLQRDNDIVAVLRTAKPITVIEEELNVLLKDSLIWAGLTILLASVMALIISRRISRPIEAMRIGAAHFARGELNYALPVPDIRELASLAESMNDMAAQLESRINTIVNQRNEYEAVLTSMIEGVIAVDAEERILSINQAAMNMLNIDPIHLKHRSLQEMIRNPELQKAVAIALKEKKSLDRDIVLHHHEDERILNLKCCPLSSVDKAKIGALLVLNDVTRMRLLEKVRRDFVANVSHELKTPLTTIKGFVETLLNGSLIENPIESERFLGIINKHVDRINTIIEDLLSLARLERLDEKIAQRFEERDLCEIVENAIQLIHSQAEAKKIQLELQCDARPRARFETTLIEQALVNLLDNAVKYSPANSQVRVHVQQDDCEITIGIQDEGPGIHKKHLPRLFERFYRADKARSRELGGTGLGLAIVKHIAQLHHGRISVETTIGKGSTFTLHLPNVTV
jgi:two-component system, OmpR family, phosphate regulon sensor histidine kinase PhoR